MFETTSQYKHANVEIDFLSIIRFAPFDLGCVIKYLGRIGHKDDPKVELEKIGNYLEICFESISVQPELYKNWFDNYGLLLRRFEKFRHLDVSKPVFQILADIEEIYLETKDYYSKLRMK